MAKASHLVLKGQTWHAVKEVPRPLRETVGKVRMVRSLKTHSLDEARRRVHAVVAQWEAEWAQLRSEKQTVVRQVVAQALKDRRTLEVSADPEEYREHLHDHAMELKDSYGKDIAERYYAIAVEGDIPVSEARDRWLIEAREEHKPQTISQHEVAFRVLLEWAGEAATVQSITKRKAGEFVEKVLIPSARARKTIKRYCSSLSSCWVWLNGRGLAHDNPWKGLNIGLRSRKAKGPQGDRRGLSDDQLIALLSMPPKGKYGDVLWDLLRMALCSGCRLDELCSLTADDVREEDGGLWITINHGKTDAARRTVPVHPWVATIVTRRRSSSEAIFPNLIAGGRDQKSSAYITKAYKTFRDSAGVSGRFADFHALRATFMEAMEGAGVPRDTVKLLVGHRRDDLTYGRYSRGTRVDLRTAIEQLSYGKAVIDLIVSNLPPPEVKKAGPGG